MKISIDDEIVDKILVARLKDDFKLLKSNIKELSKKEELRTYEHQDLINMKADLRHVRGVLRYYGVNLE